MTRLSRYTSLLRRRAVDGRLPPPVRRSLVEVVWLRAFARPRAWLAQIRRVPFLGAGPRRRLGFRHVLVSGPVRASANAAGIDHAAQLSDLLERAGVDHFLTDRERDRLVFGVDFGDRRRAARALLAHPWDGSWYVRWERGGRTGLASLDRTGLWSRFRLRTATGWDLFEARSWGERAVGPETAVGVRFWELGTSGQLELVGVRGHHRFDPRSPARDQTIDGRVFPGRSAFPVDHDLETFDGTVDIVFTWVDGEDPAWRDEFSTWTERYGLDEGQHVAITPGRYRSREELRYALRAVWFHCGWVRRVFVVTNGQVPVWLVEDDRLRVVPHSEILPDDALPTFNSHAIESSLHHIPGLAEHFVYLNDDVFIGRPLRPEDFFTANGLPKVFQSGARIPGYEDERTREVDAAALVGRDLLEQSFGRVVGTKPYHAPFPLRRSINQEIEERFPEVVARTAHSRFRNPEDLSLAASFAPHYGLATGQAVVGEITAEYVHLESSRLEWTLDRLLLGHGAETFCLNETEQPGDPERIDQLIGRFLDSYFPIPSGWEGGPNG